jgi:hypothetical protein
VDAAIAFDAESLVEDISFSAAMSSSKPGTEVMLWQSFDV